MFDSVQTWRFYSALLATSTGDTFTGIDDARAFVDRVMASPWWGEHVIYDVDVRLELAGRIDDANLVSETIPDPPGIGARTRWTLSMSPGMLTQLAVLHELAHTIAPRMILGRRPTTLGQLHGHGVRAFHDDALAGVFAGLVAEFTNADLHADLMDSYAHFKVDALSLQDYQHAVRQSLTAEADHLELLTYTSEHHPQAVAMLERVLVKPVWPMGFDLAEHRERREMSVTEAARQVAGVVQCAPEDVEVVEGLQSLPADRRLRQVALCLAVLTGMDPIRARHFHGLTRWDCGVEDLNVLRGLNPQWVELVEDMNTRLSSRPGRSVLLRREVPMNR